MLVGANAHLPLQSGVGWVLPTKHKFDAIAPVGANGHLPLQPIDKTPSGRVACPCALIFA